MIKIYEKLTRKIPGETSLFISFDYNPDIISIIKNGATVKDYDKNTREWEVPISDLSQLLDRLCTFDNNIELNVLEDKEKTYNNDIILSDCVTKPFYYQEDAVKYGLNHDSWLLLDEPGLGKSLTAIILAQELKNRHNIQHCLIVCGINTLKSNWKKEISKHSNLSSMILGERKRKNGNTYIGSISDRVNDLKNPINEFFVITNIETLRSDDIIKQLTKGKSNTFDMIVCDEIHTMKNPTSQQGKNFLKLNSARFKLGMTGTLLTNSPTDAHVPLKWIGEDRATYTNFKYYYCEFGGRFGTDLIGYRNMQYLKDQINSCSLRRTKDVLNLPPKTIINEFVDMEDDQRKFYDDIVAGVVDDVDKVKIITQTDDEEGMPSILAIMTRLRQALACPSMLTTKEIHSAKIDRACDLAEQIINNGNKIIIFSTFKQTLGELDNRLKKYNPLVCTGEMSESETSESIDKFQNSEYNRVMLATWQKMGVGITLTAASYAIFIDCPYTAGGCEQVEDRIHRVGSKNPVFIYYLWCTDTIDERIKTIVENKSIVSDYIIDNKCAPGLSQRLREIIVDLK